MKPARCGAATQAARNLCLALQPLVVAAAMLVPPAAQALTRTWACTNSLWDFEECWTPFGLPSPGDTAVLAMVGGVNTLLRFDDLTDTRVVDQLFISSAAAGPTVTFLQSGGSLTTRYTALTTGARQSGAYLQTGGVHTVTDRLQLGGGVDSTGTYTLQGGTLKTDSSVLGEFGAGKFVQLGGIHLSTVLRLEGVSSNYQLSGGSLETTIASVRGNSTFDQRAGGFTPVTLNVGELGGPSNGVARYFVLGTGRLQTATLSVGRSQSGLVEQGGTSTVVAQTLVMGTLAGPSAVDHGRYAMTGGTLTTSRATVGFSAGAQFHQQGGAHSAGSLIVGDLPNAVGEYMLSGGTLTSTSATIGNLGTGTFNHSGGTHHVDDALTIGATGVYRLLGNSVLQMPVSTSVINLGSFEHTGGRFAGTLENHGSFVYGVVGSVMPDFAGRLVNHGSVALNLSGSFGNGLRNEGSFSELVAGRWLALDGAGLENNGSIVMAGGELRGSGPLRNNGTLSGHGRIAGSSGFTNTGSVSQASGLMVLANENGHNNEGRWQLAPGAELRVQGNANMLWSEGSVVLAGGKLGGTGGFENDGWGVVSGAGTISLRFVNFGTLALAGGERLLVNGPSFDNEGLIELGASTSQLSGRTLRNNGLLNGRGRVTNYVENQAGGRIHADGGVLALGSGVANAGLLSAQPGSTLLLQGPATQQTGTIDLGGGTVDLAGVQLYNEGVITGPGTLRAGLIGNVGRLQFSDGSTQVHGAIDNLADGRIIVSGGGVATFQGAVQARTGSEVRVSTGSAAVFFGAVSQATGAAFTGSGIRYFEGGLSVGDSPGAGGADGDVVFGATNVYLAEIGGLEAGESFDHFTVGGHLGFGGTLQVVLWGGFHAEAGQRFDLFDWGSVSGRFATIDFSTATLADGLLWDTTRLYASGEIGVAAVPEPGSWALMVAGVLAMGASLRRARRNLGHGQH